MLSIKLRPDTVDAFVFSLKAAMSAALSLYACGLVGLPFGVWAAVSAVIVTQPSLHPSVRAATMRVVANLIGAFLGSGLSTLMGHTPVALVLGVLLTGLACHLTRLDEALRPAYVAVVIVTLTNNSSTWIGSFDRMLGVVIGCASALVVGYASTLSTDRLRPVRPGGESTPQPSAGTSE